MSLSEEGSSKNEKSQAGVKLRNQRTGSSNTDLGAAEQESLLTEVTPKTTGQRRGDANVKQPSKSKKEGKVKVSRGDEKVSAIGIFLKLITRGLLKKIALPAIVRLGLFNCQFGSFQSFQLSSGVFSDGNCQFGSFQLSGWVFSIGDRIIPKDLWWIYS